MDRAAVLADFQALTRIEDIEYCISLLETHQWNLSDSVAAALKDGTCDADIDVTAFGSASSPPEYPRSPLISRPTLSDQPRIRWNSYSEQRASSPGTDPPLTTSDTSSLQGAYCQTNPAGVSSTDADARLLFSSGSVRLLQFDIQLDLPASEIDEDSQTIHECFTFPDTETVGSLKRHFVEARLTELTLLATSPEWSSILPEVTSKHLVSHLAFERSGSRCFTDDSVTLRELHLPTSNLLRAYLVRKSRSTSPRSTPSSPIELQILVPYADDSIGQSSLEFRSYSLRLLPHWRLDQLRQDVAGLTEIPIARQSWSITPSTSSKQSSHSDPSLTRLIDILSRSNTNGFDKNSANPSLLELGLRSGTVYKLYLTSRRRSVSPVNTGLVPKSSAVTTTTARHTVSKSSSARKTAHQRYNEQTVDSEKQSEMDGDSDDDGEDDEMDAACWSDDNADQIRSDQANPWTTPLISEANCAGDPGEATEQFCTQFILRYCGDGETQVPPFVTGSLDSALNASVNKPIVAGRKPLFLYLHHDTSVACHLFCQRVLCSTGLVRFLGENDFSVWPWDVTIPRAKERLLGWLKGKLPGLVGVLTPLTVDSYPVLAMVGKLVGQLEVLCTILGTGAISGPRPKPLNASGFPSLDAQGIDSIMPFSGASDGVLRPDTIVAALWQAYTSYSELLAPEQAAEEERLARQRVIQEQEQAYQESLRLDRMKVEAAEKERLEQRILEEQRMHEKYQEEQRRLQMVATLPPEPPAPNSLAAAAFLVSPKGAGGIASLRFRLPRDAPLDKVTGAKNGLITRRFAGLDQLKHVFAFMESQGFPRAEYKLLTTYPRRDLTALDENATMADLKLVPQETLMIEER